MKKLLFASMLLLVTLTSTFATHLRAGYISYRRINGRTIEVTINVFVNNVETPVQFGLGQLNFGDGTSHTTAITPSSPLPGNPSVGVVRYSVTHTYPADGHYRISYSELFRNVDIINMDNSVGTTFYIESFLILNSENPQLNSGLEFVAPHAFYYPVGTPISISYAVKSEQNLFFDYRLVTPKQLLNNTAVAVRNYKFPENAQINPVNGLFSWDTKFQGLNVEGEFTFAIRVRIWSKDEDDNEIYLGSMTFDTQIILDQIEASSPTLTTKLVTDDNGRVYLPQGISKSIKFFYQPLAGASNVTLNAFSELDNVEEAYSFSTYDSATVPPGKVGVIQLNSIESINREQPFIITLRGSQNPNFKIDKTLMIYTQDVYPEVITGIENPESPIKIFPNPVGDVLTVEGDVRSMQLMNYAGATIKTWAHQSALNVGDLSAGIYFLKIETAKGIKVERILKR